MLIEISEKELHAIIQELSRGFNYYEEQLNRVAQSGNQPITQGLYEEQLKIRGELLTRLRKLHDNV